MSCCQHCLVDSEVFGVEPAVIQVCGVDLCQLHHEKSLRDSDAFWDNERIWSVLADSRPVLVPSSRLRQLGLLH